MASPRLGVIDRSASGATCKGPMESLGIIGLDPSEMEWLRLVIALLRHPDPVVGEVTRQALRYLADVAARADQSRAAG